MARGVAAIGTRRSLGHLGRLKLDAGEALSEGAAGVLVFEVDQQVLLSRGAERLPALGADDRHLCSLQAASISVSV